MSRHLDPDFDPRIADWLEGDPHAAPSDLVRTVDAALPSIPQRQVLRLPWRTLPVNRFALISTALVTVALVGVLAVTLGARTPSPQIATPSTSPVASLTAPSPSSPAVNPTASAAVEGGDMTAYRAARNAICQAVAEESTRLERRYSAIFKASSTNAVRADGIAALHTFVELNDSVVAQLDALTPPPDLLRDHIADVTQRQDESTLIAYELTLLDAGNFADAQAVDLATNPIGEQTRAYETNNSLNACP